MIKGSRSWSVIFVTLALVLPAALLISVTIVKRTRKKTDISQIGSQIRSAKEEWKKNFHPIPTAKLDFATIATNLKVDTSIVQISAKQEEKLRNTIRLFFDCYSQTNFSEYKKFRLDAPYTIKPKEFDNLEKVLQTMRPHVVPKDDEGKIHLAWDIINSTNHIAAIDPLSIVADIRSHTNLVASVFNEPQSSLRGAAAGSFANVVRTEPPANALLKSQGYLVCAHMRFFAYLSPGPDHPTPLHLIFYWNEQSERWIPAYLGFLIVGRYSTII
jgi:hypothetical protein